MQIISSGLWSTFTDFQEIQSDSEIKIHGNNNIGSYLIARMSGYGCKEITPNSWPAVEKIATVPGLGTAESYTLFALVSAQRLFNLHVQMVHPYSMWLRVGQ